MSVGGYNAQQEAELITTRAVDYRPDLLVIGYVLNDSEVGADAGLWHHFHKTPLRAYDWVSLRIQRLRLRLSKKDITEQAFDQLEHGLKGRDIPVLIAIFPILLEQPDATYPAPAQAEHARVARLARQRGFSVLDLRACLKTDQGLAKRVNINRIIAR